MKRPYFLFLLLLVFSLLLTSCTEFPENSSSLQESSSLPAESEKESYLESDGNDPMSSEKDLAKNAPYFYGLGTTIADDPFLTALTDGSNEAVLLTPSLTEDGSSYTFTSTDWNGNPRDVSLDNSSAVITVDLGFLCTLTSFTLDTDAESCEIYTSTDGSNFSFYQGTFSATGTLSVTAKAVLFRIPFGDKLQITIHAIHIYGEASAERVLLSRDATYTFGDGAVNSSKYPDPDAAKLTDGVTYATAGTGSVAGYTSNEKDPVTGKSGATVCLDLGSVRQISEVRFGWYHSAYDKIATPDRITVRVSADGIRWTDLGQSYLKTSSDAEESCSYRYFVTRPDTVEGRYVKIYTYLSARFLSDEIEVYGAENPVSAEIPSSTSVPSETDVASYLSSVLNGTATDLLTDRSEASPVAAADGENTWEISFGKTVSSLCGMAVIYTGNLSNLSVSSAGKPVPVTEQKDYLETSHRIAYVYFDSFDGADLNVQFQCSGAQLLECLVYASAPQMAIVKGGFFQLPCGGASTDNASNNSPYSWYLQLKGMKDLGMQYVVMQYCANYTSKTTTIPGELQLANGYQCGYYGSEDVFEAVLTAADRLQMDVYLGTIEGADFTNPTANTAQYQDIVEQAKWVIQDLYNRYSSHPSFAGYYLSDEECDQWINQKGGVEAARTVYQGQSDFIRSLDPDAKIMIAPAIWRSGTPSEGGDNLYRVICPGSEGERPVVDIVAAQDCLGRLDSLTVDNSTVVTFSSYLAEWAKAVRRAGAEFWNDTEVFEVTSTAKRTSETVKSLSIEAQYSGVSIVFDIPHYFTLFPSASYQDVRNAYREQQTLEYARYYASYAHLDASFAGATAPEVTTDDGKAVSSEDSGTVLERPATSVQYHAGVITKEGNSLNWQTFSRPNGNATPEYAITYDSDACYVYVLTNDTTHNYQDHCWWAGKDDLIQLWISSDGSASASVMDGKSGIRFYIHALASGWECGGTSASKATDVSAFTFAEDTETHWIRITMPWEALGVTPPVPGSGDAIGIVIQYIDGADLSWGSSNGSTGTSVSTGALYSF